MQEYKAQFLWDLCVSPFYSLNEPYGQRIDVPASFAGVAAENEDTPKRKFVAIFRTAVLLWFIATLIMDLGQKPPTLWIYLGYLTNLAFISSIWFSMSSWACTVWSRKICAQRQALTVPNNFIIMTWISYSLAAPTQLMAFILYWTLLREPVTYLGLMKHGIVGLFTIIDGAVVGKLPVRFKHFIFFAVVFLIYTIMSIVKSLVGAGDGFFDWSTNATQSSIFAFVAVFLYAPLVCVFIWWLSVIGNGRRRFIDKILPS